MADHDIDDLDAALGQIVGQNWDDPPPQPLDQIDPDGVVTKPVENPPQPAPTLAIGVVTSTEIPASVERPHEPPVGTPDPTDMGMMDIGLLTDLAAGRKTAEQAARFAGVSVDQIQSSLATALREVPPEEIAKAMGLQAAEQQLKSGALYGAVLADLVADMAAGRLKPEHKLEMAKLLARVGRVEPKEDKGASAGSGFVLNINLGSGEKPVVIESN